MGVANVEEITVFTLAPSKNDLSALFSKAGKARISPDIAVHKIKITSFQAIYFDDNAPFWS